MLECKMSPSKRTLAARIIVALTMLLTYLQYHYGFVSDLGKDNKELYDASIRKAPEDSTVMPAEVKRPPQNKCKPLNGFVGVKTHKTGSTTFMIMLNKILRERNVCSKRVMKLSGVPYCGYPGRFRHDLCIVENRPYDENTTQVDCLLGHFRFDAEEVRKVVIPNARYVTILRKPSSALESAFHYYYEKFLLREPPYFKKIPSCPGFPFVYSMGGVGTSYQEFLDRMKTYHDFSHVPWSFRIRNRQSFDLGLDEENEDFEHIIEQVQELDRQFDLVLIVDHFLESLVLLKDMMCLEWDDIVPRYANTGSYEKHKLTEEEQITVNRLLNQDIILYDYFNKTLWRKIDRYGQERMRKDVEKLRKVIQTKKSEIHSPTPMEQIPRKVNFKMVGVKERIDSIKREVLRSNVSLRRKYSLNDNYFLKVAEYMTMNNGWCPYITH